jgi:hypothetical protein
MRTRGRRRFDMILLGLGAVVGGGIVAIGGAVGDAERVTQYWAGTQISASGDATVIEYIDYDFGIAIDRHGIFRTIPGLTVETPVDVASSSAPDGIAERSPFTFDDGRRGLKLKIGDPDVTISGRHRYRLSYGLQALAPAGNLDWDPIGTDFEVPIGQTEVHVVAPWEFTTTRCFVGRAGSTDECTAVQVEPGHLVVETGHLSTGEGVSIESRRGVDLAAAPALPEPPVSAPPDPGEGLLMPAVAAATAGLGSALSTSKLVRRSGRERVGVGGVADAAWAGGGGPTGEVRLDESELREMATTEFAPPADLTPAQGGVLMAERVLAEHKVAWLIEAAIAGDIDLVEEGKKKVRIVKTGDVSGAQRTPLKRMFGGRQEIELGKYDSQFAKGWALIDGQLDAWARQSDYWDTRADQRKTTVRVLGGVLMVVGALVALGAGFAANRWGGLPWVVLIVVGSLLGGGGFAAMIRGWELRVRTPAGSGMWLRVESFRRFLHESETFHAEEAAKRGVLREYTAWAVALGEIDRWERAVSASGAIPQDAGLGYVHMAPILMSSTSSASTAPSSSSGGGGGGSVGGGGGGGGGGSW